MSVSREQSEFDRSEYRVRSRDSSLGDGVPAERPIRGSAVPELIPAVRAGVVHLAAFGLVSVVAGCSVTEIEGNDAGTASGDASQCRGDRVRNPNSGACGMPGEDGGFGDATSDAVVDGGRDVSGADTTGQNGDTERRGDTADTTGNRGADTGRRSPDSDVQSDTTDAGRDTDVLPNCPDRDGDGAKDKTCGGRDCNDSESGVSPGGYESCDTLDNDCDGTVNNGIDCSFFAHTSSRVYKVNPFKKTVKKISTQNSPTRSMFDMDTHPNGTLYSLVSGDLWKLGKMSNSWSRVGRTGISDTPVNGFAINQSGDAFATARSNVYTVNLSTAKAKKLAGLGSYRSSGDCVVDERGNLMMTSMNTGAGANDQLIEINQQTGSPNLIGTTNHSSIWGLTAAWGSLYGLTSSGDIVEIDRSNAKSSVVYPTAKSWYGAASTPASRRKNP